MTASSFSRSNKKSLAAGHGAVYNRGRFGPRRARSGRPAVALPTREIMIRLLRTLRWSAFLLIVLGLVTEAPLPLGSTQPAAEKGEKGNGTSESTLPADWAKALTWRGIGPANMAGRITAISVFEADPSTYWIASASGGLLKTVNNGVTFEHQFDKEATVSIGAVCVAPSDRNIVWVGTGENNPRN